MDDLAGLRDLRRLKLIGLGAPVVFLVVFEAFRAGILDVALTTPVSNLIAAAVGVAAALLFGLVIFFHIERAQRQMVRQNRDMAIVNAVSVAIQGELDADQVLEVALREVLRATGATEATVSMHATDPDGEPDREIVLRDPESRESDALGPPDRTVEIPLATSGAPIGRLRLTVPHDRVTTLPSPESLHMVGHQLAAALQIGGLVGDLHRRRREGHTIYQSLLQISNQAPLPETLAAIVTGARDRLAADDGRICLTEAVLHVFEGDQDLTGGLTDGIACEPPAADLPPDRAIRTHRCPIGVPSGYAFMLHVPVWTPGELLGDLWLGRVAGNPFTERDRQYLATLAGIAAIGITAARLREHERQGAILAERDRIARELHDSLAQVLGSTHLRLRTILARRDLDAQPRIAGELANLADVAEEAYRDVREAILGLREASRPRGLLESLQAYLDKYAQQSGIKVSLETSIDGELALTTNSEVQVIRVIQEALTNVRKHARATTARVRVTGDHPAGGTMIVIEDDGRGFDPVKTRVHNDGGYGLQTMRERMELAGGTLRVDSSPGRGTRVIAMLPERPRVQEPSTLVDRH